jgi:L-asparaginase
MGITLFTLGGTISMAGHQPGSPVVSRLTGAQLTAAVPGLAALGTPLTVEDVHAVPSGSLTFTHLLDLLAAASRAVRAGARGVVVSQGTDTLEETSYLADLLWPHEEPLVFTGAMRNPTLAGPDGPANLLAAALTAAAPAARGLGALVVLNDEVHAARWARKAHSTRTGAFVSPDTGPLGHVVEGGVRLFVRPPRQPVLSVDPPAVARTRVALHTVTLDDDPDVLTAVATGQDGLVVAGFGVGHVPAWFAEPLGDLAARMPVVLASRTGSGPVLHRTYGAPGSETDLRHRGLIGAGYLSPYRARVLLRLLLAGGADRDSVAAAFGRHGGDGS